MIQAILNALKAIIDTLTAFWDKLWGLVKDALQALLDLLKDVVVWVIDQVGGAVVSLLGSVSMPSELSGGLQSVFSGMPASMQWVAGELQIGTCLGIIAAAYGVRLVRKFVTLFQW